MNMLRAIQPYRVHLVAGVACCIVVIVSFLLFSSGQSQGEANQTELDPWLTQEEPDTPSEEDVDTEESSVIIVDVKGAVSSPGIYRLEASSRVDDAIRAAGGLTENADPNQLNFAMILFDEMLIYAPEIGEEGELVIAQATQPSKEGQASGDDGPLVNLNTATEKDLETLNGIGPSKSATIIAYREEHGDFQTIEELMNVSGIGEKSFEKLKAEITVK
ncbi:helix-hairpin-helix domain-containing protein [Alkalicoccobacillus murimartini]|uniref:Competence protein ComEA n=1 Tax=Alkalicoccobacillus murimartini TaxID=171685 RepID=A0ABT9YD07_9BACI|nr:helix-hairpin-helix domain-containing protein [Alkalicoccobacillus murimartini]MDQ0205513.1 competence protein ComEA [Alkalicoccobacillus murimartini]